MGEGSFRARALFLSPDGLCHTDKEVCGDPERAKDAPRPCPHSQDGRLPLLERLDEAGADAAPERGRPGDLVPTCCIQHFGSLGDWQGPGGPYPAALRDLRVFRCRKWFLLVVPGLRDDRAGEAGETP